MIGKFQVAGSILRDKSPPNTGLPRPLLSAGDVGHLPPNAQSPATHIEGFQSLLVNIGVLPLSGVVLIWFLVLLLAAAEGTAAEP